MAYFHCLIGGGSGGGYELTVTCDSDFAGTTITCTDGVTTLTQTCPSASPYEVVFEIPNGGDWTISGVVSGQTITTGVNIPTSASLIATVQQTVTIYSAKEDTISYTDIDGTTQTITFASGATSKQVQITINPNGSSITFTSSVAKNPDNLSQDYSKAFTITTSTTDIYLMPDAVNTLYWWGYNGGEIETINTSNGWTWFGSLTFDNPTYNTNEIACPSTSSHLCGIGTKISISGTVKTIIQGVTATSNTYGSLTTSTSKNVNSTYVGATDFTDALNTYSISANEHYISVQSANGKSSKIKALWYE